MRHRDQDSAPKGLTQQDLFYREVTEINTFLSSHVHLYPHMAISFPTCPSLSHLYFPMPISILTCPSVSLNIHFYPHDHFVTLFLFDMQITQRVSYHSTPVKYKTRWRDLIILYFQVNRISDIISGLLEFEKHSLSQQPTQKDYQDVIMAVNSILEVQSNYNCICS